MVSHVLTLSALASHPSVSSSSSSAASHFWSSSFSGKNRAFDCRLGCGGGGEGREILDLVDSWTMFDATERGGGGMDEAALAPFRFTEASKGCLDVDLLKLPLAATGAGVVELPLKSPMVIRINSHTTPSSLYFSCIGFEGCE
jgi:hypothetical protein